MIVSKTGYRLSLFGGSTDYPSFYKEHGALLLGAGLDKFCYVTVKSLPTFAPHNFEVYYSKTEKVKTIADISNPGVRGTLQFVQDRHPELKNLAVYIINELPAQSGVGSSSSLIVGLLNAVYHHIGFAPSKRQLAQDAIFVERVLLGEAGGIQDQIFAAYGNVSSLDIDKSGYFTIRPLPISEDFLVQLKKSCIMFYLGGERASFDIAKSHDDVKAEGHKLSIHDIALQAEQAFIKEDVEEIGRLMHESWVQKRGISNLISNSYVDDIYNKVMVNGVLGGKVMGAGGSGFLFCICPDGKRRQQVIQSIDLPYIEPGFNFTGSEIILI